MPAEIEGVCSECGARHTFFLPHGDFIDGTKAYEFVCPLAGSVGYITFRPDDWGKVVQMRPRDAVDLT